LGRLWKQKNRPNDGENSPNLVTLYATHREVGFMVAWLACDVIQWLLKTSL
jgi:hypothetical protein